MRQHLPFAKGHGTGNDFVIVPDPDGDLDLSADLVAALCDRRQGVGGDGVLRIVRTAACPEVAANADAAEWFMDYRNADGSLAQMCGNGARVFARYLVERGLAAGPRVLILTRSGVVTAEVGEDTITVDMPVPEIRGESTAQLSDVELKGTVAFCGNPNLVCAVPSPAFSTSREHRCSTRPPFRPGRTSSSTRRPDLQTPARIFMCGCGSSSAGSGRRCRADPGPARWRRWLCASTVARRRGRHRRSRRPPDGHPGRWAVPPGRARGDRGRGRRDDLTWSRSGRPFLANLGPTPATP